MLNFGASKPRVEGGPGPRTPTRIRAWFTYLPKAHRVWQLFSPVYKDPYIQI